MGKNNFKLATMAKWIKIIFGGSFIFYPLLCRKPSPFMVRI